MRTNLLDAGDEAIITDLSRGEFSRVLRSIQSTKKDEIGQKYLKSDSPKFAVNKGKNR